MFYPEELIEEVRSRSDIVSVISGSVKLTRKGSGYFGCCPFHNEKTPSFHVSPDRQTYHCFGCGVGGNVITFVMEYENYSFAEAVKQLADRAGIALPEKELTGAEKEQASLRSALLAVNGEAAKYYYYQLRSERGRRALAYLTDRGLDAETIRKFGLGYSLPMADDLYQYLKKKGFRDELLERAGLARIREKGVTDYFWNRVMFPIMDVNSRVIGFGGRVMGTGEPKYLNSPETKLFDKSRNLYGLHLARRTRRQYMLLCEGYMDVIALHRAGFDCAVASLGTALTPGHASLLKRYTSNVIIAYDSDGAGVKAAMRAIPILREAGLSVRVLDMRPYKDPDEFIVHLGAEAYQKRIDEAVNFFLYQADVLSREYDFTNPEKKTDYQRALAVRLAGFEDALERENYLQAVCQRQQIPETAMRAMMNRIGGAQLKTRQDREEDREVREEAPGAAPEPRRAGAKREKDAGMRDAQRRLLCLVVREDVTLAQIEKSIREDDFTDDIYRELFRIICEAKRAGRSVKEASLVTIFAEDEEKRDAVAKVFDGDREEETTPAGERLLDESLRRLRLHSLNTRIKKETSAEQLQKLIIQKNAAERAQLQAPRPGK